MSEAEGVVQCQAHRRVVFDNWGLGSAGINGGSEDETSKKLNLHRVYTSDQAGMER